LKITQIKKKRKRAHAVDPCLGFYSFPPSIEPQIFIEQDRRDHDVPPIVTLDPVPSLHAILDSMDPSVEFGNGRNDDIAVLTVEDFLQRSAKKPPTKSYGRRKRKIAELLSDSAGIILLHLPNVVLTVSSLRCRPHRNVDVPYFTKFIVPQNE
jgi:hypothetical protein